MFPFLVRQAVEKLRDKGAKIIRIKKQIEAELEKRNHANNTNLSEVMAGLSLSTSQINALEWTRNPDQMKKDRFTEEKKDSEENPFQILATHSGTVFSKKFIQ